MKLNMLTIKKNGISKKYYPSGKLLSEVTFKDDKEVGVLKGYMKMVN